MDILKKAADTVTNTVTGVQDAVKIYARLVKEKKNLKNAEDKVNALYAELGGMVYNDSEKDSIFLDVNYRTKINIIVGEKEKIKEIEKKISDINKLL